MKTVSIDFLFSKNDKIGSKIISWGTSHLDKELSKQGLKPSHVAILVNKRWVHESTLDSGVRVIPYKKWLQINHQLKIIHYSNMEYSKIKEHYKSLKNKKYDWFGVAYLGIWIGLKKIIPWVNIPEKNSAECPDKYFCCEVIGELIGQNLDMKSPIEVLELILSQKKGWLIKASQSLLRY